jgi:hypothetical protein
MVEKHFTLKKKVLETYKESNGQDEDEVEGDDHVVRPGDAGEGFHHHQR